MSKWPMVKLGEAIRKTTQLDPRKYSDDQFLLYSIPAYDNGAPEKCQGHSIGSSKTVLLPGDVLLSKIVPHIRRSWVVSEHDCRVLGSSEWIVFRDARFDSKYLRQYLLSDRFHQKFMMTVAGVGGSLNRARPAAVARLEIPLPPLREQKRIAGILEASARQIEDVQTQISSFEQLRSTAFSEAMSKSGSELHTLGSLCVGKPEYGIGASAAAYAPEKGRYIRITDIEDDGSLTDAPVSPAGNIDELPESKCVQQGDMLFARTGATVGKTYLHSGRKGKFWFAGYLVRFKVNTDLVDPKIVFDYCHSPAYWAWVNNRQQVAAQPNINAKVYANELMIPVPSPFAAEEYLVMRERIEANISLLKKKLGVLQELHQSLAARAFAGEL